MIKVQPLILFGLAVLLVCSACGNTDLIELEDDVAVVEKALVEVDSVYRKVDDAASLVFLKDDQLLVNSKSYGSLDAITPGQVPALRPLSSQEWELLKDNLRLLQRNGIGGFGSTRYGFTRFLYKDAPGDAYMLRYIVVDNGGLSLDHTNYRLLDRKSNLVLFSGR